MERLSVSGKRMLFWGALSLMIWAAWELSIRVDAMSRPIAMYVRMAQGENIGFFRALTYVDWVILQTPGFMLGMIVLGLLAFRSRSKPTWGFVTIPLCVAAALYTVGARALFSGNLWHLIKLLPLVLITLGSAINLLVRRKVRARYQDARADNRPGVRRWQ